MEWRITTPREVALRILAPRFGSSAAPAASSIDLADFQKSAVASAARIMKQRGGVLIADSVGLGKTFVALALIEAALAEGTNVLVVVPAALRRMWRRELKRLPQCAATVTILSHTALALGRRSSHVTGLVVVDEAHAFRNPRTARYRALRPLCRTARVVLLTATPVNNSLSDLYFQLRLCCSDSAFRDIGIGSLRAFLLTPAAPPSDVDLARLRGAVIVRRTRAQVRAAAPAGFAFPRTVLTLPVPYELPIRVAALGELLPRVTFAAYALNPRSATSAELMRLAFLKRLESSGRALRATVTRQIRYHEQFITALAGGMLLRPGTFRSLYQVEENVVQLAFDAVALEPATGDVRALKRTVESDLAALHAWLAALSPDDNKLHVLRELLAGRAGQKTLVFTEFRDTARYLWRQLRARFPTGLVDGSGAWIGESPASRRAVIERFAPVANHARVHRREEIGVLIATDVLAEGMNLQDADAVVSYDLPWNPVRLIQRAGRIDRMGSEHDVVKVYNMLPDREFDAFLGLVRTIRTKLAVVRGAVGLEHAVLEPDDAFESVMRAVRAAADGALDRIEQDTESEARLRIQFCELPPIAGIPVAAIPARNGWRGFVVGLSRGTDWWVVALDPEGAEPSANVADPILECALQHGEAGRAPTGDWRRTVADMLARLNARAAAAPLERRSAAAAVARQIRNALIDLPFDEPAGVYERADGVLAALGGVLSAAAEDALEPIARRRFTGCADLLDAVENALRSAEFPRENEAPWQLTGVLVLD